MATFENVQKAVQNKTDHLKDVAKMDTLATELSQEFNKVSSSLRQQKEQLPKILKGFDETQIHRITRNAEVKEEQAKKQLESAVDSLIAMLQGKQTVVTEAVGSTATNAPTAQETLRQEAPISKELAQEADTAVRNARNIIAQFNPQNMEEVKTMLPQLEQALQSFEVAKKVYTLLPEGNDKQELKDMITEMEKYKKELQEKKPLLNNPLAGTMFGMVQKELQGAKQQALSMIGTFDRITKKYSTAPSAEATSTPAETSTNSAPVQQSTVEQQTEKSTAEMLRSVLSKAPLEQFVEKGKLPSNLREMVSSARPGQYLTDIGTYYSDRGDPVREFPLQNIDTVKSNSYQIIAGGERFIRRYPEGTETKIYTLTQGEFQKLTEGTSNTTLQTEIVDNLRAELRIPAEKKVYFATHTHGVNRDRFALTVRIQP